MAKFGPLSYFVLSDAIAARPAAVIAVRAVRSQNTTAQPDLILRCFLTKEKIFTNTKEMSQNIHSKQLIVQPNLFFIFKKKSLDLAEAVG